MEVAGGPLHPGALQRALLTLLEGGELPPGARPGLRVVRAKGSHAIVEVSHRFLPAARQCWNAGPVRTLRTWGTLRGAKRWLREADDRRGSPAGRKGLM